MLSVTLAAAAALAVAHPPPAPKPLHEIRLHPKRNIAIWCAAFFPDGKTAVLGGGGPLGPGEMLFWDVAAGRPRHAHAAHKFAIHAVAVSPDGKRVVTGGGFGQVKVWDAAGKVTADLDGGAEDTVAVAFSPDGRYVAHCGGQLTIRETAKFEVVATPDKPAKFGTLGAFFPDGKTLVGASAHGEVRFLSVSGWKETTHRTAVPGLEYYSPVVSPDGKTLAVGTLIRAKAGFVFTTEVWAVSAPKLEKKRFEVADNHLGMAFTPDGRYLLLGEADAAAGHKLLRIRAWDVGSGKEVVSWAAGDSCIRHLAVSPDGTRLISCHDEWVARVWDLKAILGNK